MEHPLYQDKTVSTEIFLRAAKFQTLNIAEEVKARFLVYLVKEFRKNKEITKHLSHQQYISNEVEDKIKPRMSSLGRSEGSEED